MKDWRQWCRGKLVSPEKAVSEISSGERVVFGNWGNLWCIVRALSERYQDLRGVTVVARSGVAEPFIAPGREESFEYWETFLAFRNREAARTKRIQFCNEPFGLCHPWRLLEPGRASFNLGGDWAIIPVTPPNANGYCSFGHNVHHNKSKAETARKVIAVVQENFPWTYGDTISLDRIDYMVETEPMPHEAELLGRRAPEDEARAADVIGALASELIRDGDTIQIGTGTASFATESYLGTKNDLGAHTEVFDPVGILEGVKSGIINGKKKNINPGKVVMSFFVCPPHGPQEECLDFFNYNPLFEFRDLSYVNSIPVIAAHDNMVAINSIVALDLRGQAIAEHVGLDPISGVGGNLDFTIGSHYSRGGRSVYCLISTAIGGTVSRIVPRFPEGAPVTCPSFFADYLVTEYGVVNLEGRTPQQRAEAIISVAHPNFQSELRREARKMFWP